MTIKSNFIFVHFFYNPTAQNTWDFPKITPIWNQDIYFVVDMDYVDESDVVMFTVKKTDLTISFSPVSLFKTMF